METRHDNNGELHSSHGDKNWLPRTSSLFPSAEIPVVKYNNVGLLQ